MKALALLLAPVLVAGAVATTSVEPAQAAPPPQLANLAHLDELATSLVPPAAAGHTTYRLAQEPSIGVLWTYAEPAAGGGWRLVGGGPYDPATGTWSQGAYNSDDIARASVAYLRYWRQHHDAHSGQAARELLRGLTFMQTTTGPNRGNVVLWMQPDGTLNPSPTPVELPDPSDSGASYWLARSAWALGEGYAAFRTTDPAFAGFLRGRLDLALGALERQVLTRYGQWQVADGVRVPAWLVVDGSDASAEAVLGLAAFVAADRRDDAVHRRAATATRQLAEGVAAMAAGSTRQWPYGAILPWAQSRSDWHAWASQQPAALAAAATALHDPSLLPAAVGDMAGFTPKQLIDDGADNALLPTRIDTSQIAYGVDSRLESLLSVGAAAGAPGLRDLAAVDAAWFFGANRAGQAMYDPATGVTFDGLAPDGGINRNSGAESTIHGVLAMVALDGAPAVKARALRLTQVLARDGGFQFEGESGVLGGGATATTVASPWTGESQVSGGAYATLPVGGTVQWALPAGSGERTVEPVLDLPVSGRQTLRWRADGDWLGRTSTRGVGAQGITAAPGALLPVPLPRTVGAGATTLSVTATTGTSSLDALVVSPVVSSLTLGAAGTPVLRLLRSSASAPRTVPSGLAVAAVATAYDSRGALVSRTGVAAGGSVTVAPGGFTTVESQG
ncbi:hypothetical protein CLV35_3245 [Motilibacter peucedani]|uniref:Uncharacterized protein n=1 Tax=Motilibacter peucedani TaxID=598650 RepID=A0A420XLP8_9ACTN|nr:hypothetical protein [Motilibacter peucedani]RKS71447.1 hypothetical protein CLV35_3245 [Motilibacter peucedani]